MKITANQLLIILPANKYTADLAEVLNELFPKYGITTLNRAAGFIAQCGHESNGFTVLKENLNYSAQGLRGVFSKYFKDDATAAAYARQPEKIANRVYASRMGNSNEQSGDGYKYRGRGAIQLTGKENYTRFADSINKDMDATIEYLGTLDGAVESACWFWKANNLNTICDEDDIVKMTKRINGGTIGLEDRASHYTLAKQVLAAVFSGTIQENTPQVEYITVSIGSNNDTVKAVQLALGITADGDFGPGTERAVKTWQSANGLAADGIVGPNTIRKMLGN
jgi:putative chitinase